MSEEEEGAEPTRLAAINDAFVALLRKYHHEREGTGGTIQSESPRVFHRPIEIRRNGFL